MTINAAASRVWQEVQGDWSWWLDGGSTASNKARVLSDSRLFRAELTLDPPPKTSALSLTGNLTGAVTGRVVLEVKPHCCIPLRTVLTVRLENTRRNTWFVGDNLLARSLLWACRGELSWYPSVRGFSGLVRKLEGFVGARNDVLEDAQLDALVARNASAVQLWASTLDTNVALDDHPAIAAAQPVDLLSVLADEGGSRRVFLHFLVQVDPEQEQEAAGEGQQGWSLRSKVKVDLLQGGGKEELVSNPLSFVLDEAARLSLRIRVTNEQQVELVVARLLPAPPGVMHQVAVVFQSNWTCLVTVDEAAAPVRVVIPESVREHVAIDEISALELRANVRAELKYVLACDDEALFAEVCYFAARRVAAVRDAHSLAGSSGRFDGAPALTWSSLGLLVALLAGVPLAVTRLAAFDSSLIPKKGLADKPLLYFRLAPSAVLTHMGVAACAALCLLLSLLLHSTGSFPSVVAALTTRAPEVLLWRVAVSVLTVQRIGEAYLGFKTYIDKLTEKSYRVAFPLFDFRFWLWMNRVSLVAHVLETLSLLIVSLSSPVTSAYAQQVALVLFYVFHLIHVFSHFRTFFEIKRSYHDDVVTRLRAILNAAVGTVLCVVAFRVGFALTGASGLDVAAVLCEWAFFAVTFGWHHTVQREFVAPEDTRLYVGRRIALGASIRCSECLRPFSRSRTRETCADCRDECCVECGTEMHLSELGSTVDMMCFFCSKCHRLLQAEVTTSRVRRLNRPPMAGVASAPSSGGGGGGGGSGGGMTSGDSSGSVEVCRMFQYGDCKYGESCRYLHIESRRGRAGSRPAAARPAVAHPTARLAEFEQGRLGVTPLERSGTPMPDVSIVGPEHESFDSSSGLDKESLSSIERKKRRRGKRGQRKKKTLTAQSGESDGLEELMMQEADVDDEDDEKDKID